MPQLWGAGEDRVVRAARESQALVIAITECLSQAHPRPLASLWKLNLDLAGLMAEPTQALDDAYTLAQRLVALHREFAHRLFEAMDPGVSPLSAPGAANVLPFARRRGG